MERTTYAVQVGRASKGPMFPELQQALSEAHRLADETGTTVTVWAVQVASNGLDFDDATEFQRVEPGDAAAGP
jgi:hypothetical protein